MEAYEIYTPQELQVKGDFLIATYEGRYIRAFRTNEVTHFEYWPTEDGRAKIMILLKGEAEYIRWEDSAWRVVEIMELLTKGL